jgi:4-amino-4-deoxy-L-arabinose transferase-like glycosyltransferase
LTAARRDAEPARTSAGSGFVLGLAAVTAAAALALWWPSFREVALDRDEGIYAAVAQGWASGRLLYRDVFDHKPPGIFLAYRTLLAAFGDSLVPVRMAFALLTALTGVAAALVLRALRPESPRADLAVVALAVVYLQASAAVGGGAANSEILMMPLVTAAALVALRARAEPSARRLAALGLASAAALLVKPVCGLELLLFFAVTASGTRFRVAARRDIAAWLGAYAAGGLAPVLAAVAYFAARGGLAEAVEAVVTYNLAYVGAGPVPAAVRFGYLAREAAAGFAPFLFGWAVLAATMLRRRRSIAVWLPLLWPLAAAAGALTAGRPYLHYLQQLTVPLALATVTAVALLAAAAPAAARRRLRAAAAAAALALLLPSLRATAAERRAWAAAPEWETELGRFLAERVPPGETVLVWGASAQVYLYAGRLPAGRFVVNYPLIGDSAFAERARRELHATLLAAPPGAIIVLRNDATGELARASDIEWEATMAPALTPLLQRYARSVTEPCIIYLRRR